MSMARVTMTTEYKKAYEKGIEDKEKGNPPTPPEKEKDAYIRGYKGKQPEKFKHITGRPRIGKGKSVRISSRLDEETYNKFLQERTLKNLSESEAIREAVQLYLQNNQ